MMRTALMPGGLLLALLLPLAAAAADEPRLQPRPCPNGMPADVRCFAGQDEQGAWVVAAIPAAGNGELVVHAHGGPSLGVPAVVDSEEDLQRYPALLEAGYSWVGSTYRQGGFAVRRAAADVETSRRLFIRQFGVPRRTWLHGQSWGAQVAIKVHELHALADDGGRRYDGVLLTNGVVQGASRAYQFRADLRAVYQYLCGNHPAPGEVAYPLWSGLPANADLDEDDLKQRVDACTGLLQAPQERSALQAARLRDLLAVTSIREDQLLRHLNWATFTFRSLVQGLGGANPFDNTTRRYSGSSDDTALNAGVARFAADPRAVARLAWDGDPTGQWVLPTISLHAVRDPVATVQAEHVLAQIVDRAGRADLLVQAGVDSDNHSRPSGDLMLAALEALRDWVAGAAPPRPAELQARCLARKPAARCPLLPLPPPS